MTLINNFTNNAKQIYEGFFELFFKAFWQMNTIRSMPGVYNKLSMLETDQYTTIEQIDKKQFRAVKALLNHAYNNCPFYKIKLLSVGIYPDKIKSWEDFSKIPLLTKKDIQQNLAGLISKNAEKTSLIKDATGGSTGEPIIFYHDLVIKEWFEACDIFVKKWWGIKPWDKKAFLWGADRDIPDWSFKEKIKLILERSVFLNSFDMDDEKMKNFAGFIQKWKPEYMQGYASSLYFFAEFLHRDKISVPKPEAVRSSAETLHDYQRRIIEKALGNRIYNFYGSREITNIAVECPAHRGLHVFSPIRYVEVLKSSGEMAEDGEIGKIVITDLVNYSMPFIRYEIGDIGIKTKEQCRCGCFFPLLKSVKGRETDFIQTIEGKYIHGEFFTHLFYGVENVLNFQVRQNDMKSLYIDIVKGGEISPLFLKKIKAKIREKMGKHTEIKINFVDVISLPKSGKHSFTISDIPPVF